MLWLTYGWLIFGSELLRWDLERILVLEVAYAPISYTDLLHLIFPTPTSLSYVWPFSLYAVFYFFTAYLPLFPPYFYFTTGRMWALLLAFCLKLAIFPSCNWLVEIHAQLPTQGSLLLSAIYVKLGWLGLLKYSTRVLSGCSSSGWGMMGELAIMSACAGVFFLSLCLVCASTVKVLLAIQSALHANLVLPYALMTPNTSELLGVSWAHSLSSGTHFLYSCLLHFPRPRCSVLIMSPFCMLVYYPAIFVSYVFYVYGLVPRCAPLSTMGCCAVQLSGFIYFPS